MKLYRAISTFDDITDNNHRYNAGDNYPRKGLTVSETRISELSGYNNKRNRPVIEAYEVKKFTVKNLESMTISQIEKLADELGYKITKTLKADIIDEFMKQQ